MKILDMFRKNSSAPIVSGVTLELENASNEGVSLGKKDTKRMAEPTKRVGKKDLQLIYNRDDVAFNGINKLVKLIMSSEMYWDTEDESDREYMELWSENTGFWEKTYETFKNAFIFGIGWQEIMTADKDGEDVAVGVDVVDSKTMDFMRDTQNRIIYNEYGTPEGYVQKIPYGTEPAPGREYSGGPPGEKLQKFGVDEISYFTFNHLGGSVDGIGLVEPQYDIVRRKKSIEKANTQSAIRRGNPRYHIKTGNEKYRAGPDERKRLDEELKKLKPQDDIITDWWVDINTLEADVPTEIERILRYYVARQASCMGIPMAYVSEEGEATNRSTLHDQKILLFKTIETYRKRYSLLFDKQVMPVIQRNRKFKTTPKLRWENVALDDKESRSIRLQRYAKAGLLTYDKELEKAIRRMEDLPDLSGDGRDSEDGEDNQGG